ncbi:SRPBCC domain-containing protein [Pseudonocardia kunmingensis]|uniref:TetR family transcriptional regulator n=1 Tax=Pseudonocardia kunmingensis TaxID=630975 RepID=A0A543DAL7_9PSEU|nr:SRPBCC domain-containing protein [Pseudonocardia kunmingensis]TQM06370.1 TetR family transcriptional regulator [Pseudonocardia kunmingensis]
MEAAAQVFEREGLTVTTNRIAERAGVSIGTLYQYFPHKQALLYELADRHVAAARLRLDSELTRLRAHPPEWEDAIRALVDALVELHATRPRLHALMREYAPRVPDGVARLHALQDRLTDEIAALLRRYGRGGPAPERTAALLVQAADAQLHRVVLAGRGDAEDLVRALLALAGPGSRYPGSRGSPATDQFCRPRRSTSRRLHHGANHSEEMNMSETTTPGYSYTLTRELDAPVENVWAAWTQPDHYAQWSGAVRSTIELDVRPGGAWRATMAAPDGSEFPLTGSYGEVVENRRLEVHMDLPGGASTAMAVDLTDLGGGKTRIAVSQTCATEQERDGSEQGSGMLLDGLAAYVPSI